MMKKLLPTIFLISCITSLPAYSLTGREIMKKNEDLTEASSSRQSGILLILKGSFKEKKEYSAVSKKYGKKTRTRMNFTYPSRIGFLIWDRPGADSSQWLKLSSGRVRKVSSADRGNPWMNSHFYNEDIGDQDIDDYRYTLQGETTLNGTQCYRIRAIKIRGSRVYDRTVIYVGRKNYLIQKVDFFEKGRLSKSLTFLKYQKIQGIWTPRKTVMSRSDGRGKSIMYVRSVEYNVPVSDSSLKLAGF